MICKICVNNYTHFKNYTDNILIFCNIFIYIFNIVIWLRCTLVLMIDQNEYKGHINGYIFFLFNLKVHRCFIDKVYMCFKYKPNLYYF